METELNTLAWIVGFTTDDGQSLLLRPIRPEDEPALQATFARLTPEEVRFRFFVPMKRMVPPLATRSRTKT